jgi:hypothetical protein
MIWSQNSSSGSRGFGLSRNITLPFLLVLVFATAGWAQGFGPDPFQPYNSRFNPFVYPVAPGPLDYGWNTGRNTEPVAGIRGANQFENYMNSLQGIGGGARQGAGAGTPYYRANRAYDREYNRVYQPNKEADAQFESNQEMVTDLYFKYLREKDPKKRAELFRDYNRARSRADRELASPRGANPRPVTRTPRREGSTTKPAEATGSQNRDLLSAPPALRSETTRSRSGSARSGADSAIGPAPPLIGGSTATTGSAPGVSPSQVLDRATRSERPRVGPRPRRPGLLPSSPPPP